MHCTNHSVSLETVETALETLSNYLDEQVSEKDSKVALTSHKLLMQALQEMKEEAHSSE